MELAPAQASPGVALNAYHDRCAVPVDFDLIVNGRRYNGWKSIRVTQSIENLAGSFALEVADRWAWQNEIWPIQEEDACRVEMVDRESGRTQPVIDGFIDERDLSLTDKALSLSYSGRDKAAALVDCSMTVEGASVTGHKWTYRNVDIEQFAREIADQFDIRVSVQPGLVLKKDPLLVAHPGESGFEAIKRAAGSAGVLVVSDGSGGIVITRAGTARASALIQGFNVQAAAVKYDGKDRYRRYLISSQIPGTDDAYGDATSVLAEAQDLGVKRTDRILVIRPEKAMNAADAKRRGDWEARIRAAKAATVTVTVKGWTQPHSNELWPLNALTWVQVPRIGIDGDLLISQVEFTIGPDGQSTQLRLVRPDAFEPDPQARVTASVPWLISVGGEFREPK